MEHDQGFALFRTPGRFGPLPGIDSRPILCSSRAGGRGSGGSRAKRVAEGFCSGLVREQGLRIKVRYAVREVRCWKQIFYPFWIGNRYDFEAVNGLAGEIQGPATRKTFLEAFRQLDGDPRQQSAV